MQAENHHFQLSELEAFIGTENLCDYDLTAIIQEATYTDFQDPDRRRYWKDGIDLGEICANHDLTAEPAPTVDVSEASRMLGVSRQRVHQLMQSGRLDGRKVGKTWYIASESIDDYVKSRNSRVR